MPRLMNQKMSVDPNNIDPPIDEQDATPDGLISVVEDRPAIRSPNLVDDEYCNRCEQVAHVYRRAGVDHTRSSKIHDGERIRFFAWFNASPDDGEVVEGWQITMLHHIDHVEKDIEEVARPGGAQAFGTATLDRCGWEYTYHFLSDDGDDDTHYVPDRGVLRDVTIQSFSQIGYGTEDTSPDREPNEHGIVELKPTDPRPNFPAELNRWRKSILKANDAWNDRLPSFGVNDADG
jgi:hypothetical protein